MYAIRSYYGTDLAAADDDPTRTRIRQVLAAVAQFDKSVTVLKLVITSYSIHYTKLYEPSPS